MSSDLDEATLALRAFTISSPTRNSNSGSMLQQHTRQESIDIEDTHGGVNILELEELAESCPPPTLQTLPTELLGQILGNVEDYRIACRTRFNELAGQNKYEYYYGKTVNRTFVSNNKDRGAPPAFYADHLVSTFNSTRRMRLVCKAFNNILMPLVFRDIELTPRWLFALHRGRNIVKNYNRSTDDFLGNICTYTEHVAIIQGDVNRTNGARYHLERLIRSGVILKSFTWTLQREQTLVQLIRNTIISAIRQNPHVGLHVLRLDIENRSMVTSLPAQNLLSISTDGLPGTSRVEFLTLLLEAKNVEKVEYTSCLTPIQPTTLLQCVTKVGNEPVKLPAWKELVSFPDDPRFGMIHKAFEGVNLQCDFLKLESLTTHLASPPVYGCILSRMPTEAKAKLKRLNISTHLTDYEAPQNGLQILLLRNALTGLDSLEELVIFGNHFFAIIHSVGENLPGLKRLHLKRHILYRHSWNDPLTDMHTAMAPTYTLNKYFGLECTYDDIWRLVHCCRDLEVLHLDFHGGDGLDEAIVRILQLPLLYTLSITIPSHLPELSFELAEFDHHAPPRLVPISTNFKRYGIDVFSTVMEHKPKKSKIKLLELRIGWEEEKGKLFVGEVGACRNGEGDAVFWWFGGDDDEEFRGQKILFKW